MDITIRNEITLNYDYLIKAIIRRNLPLIKALRLDTDDVYQDLMIAALNAVDSYNPARSDSIISHIFAKLQYAILDMKRRHKPGGITGIGKNRVTLVSVEYYYDDGNALDIPVEDDISAVDLSDILTALSLSERDVLEMNMNGYNIRKKNQRKDLFTACEKVFALL